MMGGLTVSRNNDIELEFDDETRNYYIVWEPIVISLGKTRQKALEDLRRAAHFGMDTLIDLKLKDIGKGEN
jgi:predicted RNase H-like HicB family nuclease